MTENRTLQGVYGGPDPISLTNVSPWITTVGASTMDRDFPATVKVGTMKTFKGVSLYKGRTVMSKTKQYPLVYLGKNASSPGPTSFCLDGALDRRHVVGKIVIYDRGVTLRVQKVGEKENKLIKQYAMTSKKTTSTLEILGTRIGIKPSPIVAAFSSRGPIFLSLEILKPDLLAPALRREHSCSLDWRHGAIEFII
ncbi:unnamed protein product [Arabidopsis halleri]